MTSSTPGFLRYGDVILLLGNTSVSVNTGTTEAPEYETWKTLTLVAQASSTAVTLLSVQGTTSPEPLIVTPSPNSKKVIGDVVETGDKMYLVLQRDSTVALASNLALTDNPEQPGAAFSSNSSKWVEVYFDTTCQLSAQVPKNQLYASFKVFASEVPDGTKNVRFELGYNIGRQQYEWYEMNFPDGTNSFALNVIDTTVPSKSSDKLRKPFQISVIIILTAWCVLLIAWLIPVLMDFFGKSSRTGSTTMQSFMKT